MKMRLSRAVVGMALVLAWAPAAAWGQQAKIEASDFSATLGVRTWVTTGYSEFSLNNLVVDPASDLIWRNTDSAVFEVNGELIWRRFLVMGALGTGGITDGAFIDDDFLLNDRRGRFSHTRSIVDGGDVFYGIVDVGARLGIWGEEGKTGAGFFDAFLGYQYWREEYEAFGLRGSAVRPNSVKVITHEYIWQGLRLGARSELILFGGLSVKWKAVLLPVAWWSWEDIHHLRTDLRQDPSASAESDDAFGFELEAGLKYNVWRGLSVEAGYRYWGMDSNGGDVEFRAVAGTVRLKVHDATSERYGPYFGLQYRF